MMSIKIKVSGTGLEFDPEKETKPLKCPECKAPLVVTLGQIQRQETVQCKSCQTNIHLEDKNGSAAKAVTNISNAFDELRRTIEDFGH